jgi:hypothetical protein
MSGKRGVMRSNSLQDIPLLVVSCDGYSDLWRPFFCLFRSRWPDCPFPVYLGTNYMVCHEPSVTTITVGEDISWTTGLRSMIDHVGGEYVLLFLEDFLLKRDVDTDRVLQSISIAVERNVGCLRLTAGLPLAFPPSAPVDGIDNIGSINKGEPYRVSAQVALWRTDVLRELLVPGMDPWEFEEIGTRLSTRLEPPFWGVYQREIDYVQSVEKGKWKPEGLALCRQAGVPVDLDRRPAFAAHEWEEYVANVIAENSRPGMQMQRAIRCFTTGQTWAGVRIMLALLKAKPLDLRQWLVLSIGLLWPSLILILARRRLKQKLVTIAHRLESEKSTYAR